MCAIAFSKAVRNLMCGIIWGLVDISMSRADFGVIALLKMERLSGGGEGLEA